MCDDHSVGFLLPTWCKSSCFVGTYLFAASCSIFCLFFCCYTTLILHSLQKNGSWRLLLPILVPVNLLDVVFIP
jgi:fumarate reductase subunit C